MTTIKTCFNCFGIEKFRQSFKVYTQHTELAGNSSPPPLAREGGGKSPKWLEGLKEKFFRLSHPPCG